MPITEGGEPIGYALITIAEHGTYTHDLVALHSAAAIGIEDMPDNVASAINSYERHGGYGGFSLFEYLQKLGL